MQTARQVALIALGGYGRDMVARRKHEPSAARVASADQRVARELVALLGDGRPRGRFELRGEDGRAAPLSGPMLTLIERAARIVAEGTAVDVLAHDEELTSREAAVLLGVSRQYLVRLLDRGEDRKSTRLNSSH